MPLLKNKIKPMNQKKRIWMFENMPTTMTGGKQNESIIRNLSKEYDKLKTA